MGSCLGYMEFHPAKCVNIHVTRARRPTTNQYHLHGHPLENVESFKYLGVTVKKDLTWDEHVHNITNKTFGFLKQNLKISSPKIKDKA